jgi:hypothetical protein
MNHDLALTISHDEALVLFGLFARFAGTDQLIFHHNAEF